jgi:hypothetical protein
VDVANAYRTVDQFCFGSAANAAGVGNQLAVARTGAAKRVELLSLDIADALSFVGTQVGNIQTRNAVVELVDIAAVARTSAVIWIENLVLDRADARSSVD